MDDIRVTGLGPRAPAPVRPPLGGGVAPPAGSGVRPAGETVPGDVLRTAIERRSSVPVASGGTRLRVDKPTGRIVAQILDENQNVIRQIPPEEMLRISTRLRELNGLLFDERA